MAVPGEATVGIVPFRQVRLRKHADYGLVYSSSRKHRSQTLAYFYRERSDDLPARFGITTPRALGPAVLRNRVKRRLRAVCRPALALLPLGVDVVLHPRAEVATLPFPALQVEIASVFSNIARRIAAHAENTPLPRGPRKRK